MTIGIPKIVANLIQSQSRHLAFVYQIISFHRQYGGEPTNY